MSSVAEILRSAADTYELKAKDYAPSPDRPWQNFEESAAWVSSVTGLPITPEAQCLALIAVKIGRLATVTIKREAANETVLDTLTDLIVYAAILRAMLEAKK